MEMEKKEYNKLGNAIEDLNNAVIQKDMEKALNIFKILKENKYSVFIEKNKKINKDNYNNVILENNNKEIDLSLKK
jgi:hypothetical protein